MSRTPSAAARPLKTIQQCPQCGTLTMLSRCPNCDVPTATAGDGGAPAAAATPRKTTTTTGLSPAGVATSGRTVSAGAGAAPLAPLVEFHSSSSTVTVTPHEGSVAVWTFAQLRAACLGAGNDKKRQALGVRPVGMRARGNYAVGISWSDGHESIYPYRPAPNNNTAFVY